MPQALCNECTLKGCKFVPSYGPKDAVLIVVGEAPGTEEAKEGRPFVGKSGSVLRKALESIGIDLERVFFCNACSCRPEPHRAPNAKDIKACKPRLLEEIMSNDAKIILALGNVPLRSLTGLTKMRDFRGKLMKHETGKYLLATYHPASMFRQPGNYIDFVKDINRVVDILSRGVVEAVPKSNDVEMVLIDTEVGLEMLRNRLSDGLRPIREVAYDVETSGLRPDADVLSLALAWTPTSAVVISGNMLKTGACVDLLNEMFSKRDVSFITAEGGFDMGVLWRLGVTNARVDHDVILMHYMMDERQGIHSLKAICSEYGIFNYDAEVLAAREEGRLSELDSYTLYQYNAKDATNTLKAYHILSEDGVLDPLALKCYKQILIPAQRALTKVESIGLMVDSAYVDAYDAELSESISVLERELRELAGRDINLRSPKQISDLIYKEFKLPYVSGMDGTSQEVLEMLENDHPFVAKLLEYRKLEKLRSTYTAGIKSLVGPDGRVRTKFNLHGTVTGRLSSGDRANGLLNLQNIPRDPKARNMFISTPGYTLVEADFSQAELRVLAWFSGDKKLVDAICSGEDLHKMTASIMLKVPIDEVTKEQRTVGKTLNFATIYGQTEYALSRKLKCSVSEAKSLIDKFFEEYKGVKEWRFGIQEFVRKNGFVITPLGRRRRFEFLVKENESKIYREAVNFPIQSVAADLTLVSLTRIVNGDLIPGRVLLTVHDSILAEAPSRGEAVECGRIMRDVMIKVPKDLLNMNIPFDVDAKVGSRWGDLVEVDFS